MNSSTIFKKCASFPFGNFIFSKLVCFKAPYFSTIKPLIYQLSNGTCKAKIKKRRSITNHIGSIHAIAMCNLAELCGGLAIDSCIPKHLRWIPVGMSVKYLKKAKTDLNCSVVVDTSLLQEGENDVLVDIKDANQETVFTAKIQMLVSKKIVISSV